MNLTDFNPLNLFKQDTNTELYNDGDTIFSRGGKAHHTYVVMAGYVEIKSNGSVLDIIEASEIFGEMALIDPNPRSAPAVASTDCELVPVDHKRFTSMIQHPPFFAVYVMRILADRLHPTSGNVSVK